MSWLARSLADSLRLDDDDSPESGIAPSPSSPVKPNEEAAQAPPREYGHQLYETNEDENAQGRGVKEDLTELKQTLTRQLWGVANFLAPPSTDDQSALPDPEMCDRSGSGDDAEASKAAPNYPRYGTEWRNDDAEVGITDEEEEDCGSHGGAVGITEEVLAFARNIAMHPETWLDFPLDEEDDLDDFSMSDVQREHAFTIEQLAPRLAALRIELCPCHMSKSYFWKVYFVLLHSRLHKYDAELLSTPQVMEARAMWMHELHKQTKSGDDWFGTSTSYIEDSASTIHEDFVCARSFNFNRAIDHETEKHPIASTSEMHFIDKSVIEEKPVIKTEKTELLVVASSKTLLDYEDDDDDWPEEDSDLGGYKTTFPVGNEEDISFSDLEDDECNLVPIKSKAFSTSTEKSTM